MDLLEAPFQVPRLRKRGLYASVYDIMRWVTGKSLEACRRMWSRLLVSHPELEANCLQFKFNHHGRGSHQETPGADARTAVEIIMVLPGEGATRFRQKAADAVVRYLGGDPRLVQEVWANREAQEGLDPSHPARFFGEAVEADLETNYVRDSDSETDTLEQELLWSRIQRERAEAENLRAQQLLAIITAVEAAGRIPGVANDSRYFSLRRDVALRALMPGHDDCVDAAEYLRLQGLTDEAIARLAGSFSKLLRVAFMRCYGEPSNGKYCRTQHRAFLAAGYQAFAQKESFRRVAGGDLQRARDAIAGE